MNTRIVIAALIAASVIAPAAQAAAMLPKAAVTTTAKAPLVTKVNAVVKAQKPATLVKKIKVHKIHRKHHAMAMAKKY